MVSASSKRKNIIFVSIAFVVLLMSISSRREQNHHRSLEMRNVSRLKGDKAPGNELPINIGVSHGTSMLLGIFSMSTKKASRRRELIRRTYLYNDSRVCSLQEYQKQSLESPHQRICQIPYTFVIGAGKLSRPQDHDDNEPLLLETDQNGAVEIDCTYLNIKENMEKGKSTTYLKYATSVAKISGLDFIAKIDDDTVMSMPLLLEFIDDELPPTPFNRRIYGGSFVPSRELQHIYAQGQFYFMSIDLADYVANSISATERERNSIFIEDLDMGTFIQSHPRPIKLMDITTRMFWIHPRKWEGQFVSTIVRQVSSLPHRKQPMVNFSYYCPHWAKGEFHM